MPPFRDPQPMILEKERPMRHTGWGKLGDAIALASVMVAALFVFGGAARQVPYHGDEGRYMARARYFAYLFVQHDLTRPEWGDSEATHTQPMLTNYLIGGWLWARGYNLVDLPLATSAAYDFSKSPRQNRLEERGPDPTLVADARRPIVLIAACAIAILYLLGCALGGPLAGLTAALLALASPLAREFLVRTTSEAPLICFLLLVLLLAVLGIRRGHRGGLRVRWALAIGVALGLGLATKLTAALSLATTLSWGVLVALLSAWLGHSPNPPDRLRRARGAGSGWALAIVVALSVFVLSDPHLYPNPLQHTAHLVEYRADDMLMQQRQSPQFAVHSPVDRLRYVLGGSLVGGTWTGSRTLSPEASLETALVTADAYGPPVEAALAVMGAAALLGRAWRGWRRTGQIPGEGLALLTVAIYFIGVSAGLLVPWSRYLVSTTILGILLSGVGVSTIAGQLMATVEALRARACSAAGCPPKLRRPGAVDSAGGEARV
jgi:hypothetical protein